MYANLLLVLAVVWAATGIGLMHAAAKRRRAERARAKTASYPRLLDALLGALEGVVPAGKDALDPIPALLVEVGKRLGLPDGELEKLTTRLAGRGPALPGRPPDPGGSPSAEASPRPRVEALATLRDTRYLFVSFEEEIRRAEQQNLPLTLLELCLEAPEAGKDPFGPSGGDRMIRGVAHAIRSRMRGCDTCVRHTGDEFILILPGVSREESRKVEERIRAAVEKTPGAPRAGKPAHVRASLGSATYPEDGGGLDRLLAVAGGRRLGARPGGKHGTDPRQFIPFTLPSRTLSRN